MGGWWVRGGPSSRQEADRGEEAEEPRGIWVGQHSVMRQQVTTDCLKGGVQEGVQVVLLSFGVCG